MALTQRQPIAQTAPPTNGGPRKRRMTLDTVTTSSRTERRILVYGVDGVGKTSLGAAAPSPIFLDLENGMPRELVGQIPRFPLPEQVVWQDILDAIDELASKEHPYKTFVIDPLDRLEPICWASVCERSKTKDIEEVGGGFQKGYLAALDEWRQLIAGLERLRGMSIIMLAHSVTAQFKNPEGADYLRYQVGLHPKAAGLFREWSDAVLFARYESTVKSDKRKVQGVSTGRRIMETQWNAAWDAKNRYSLPEFLPLDWSALDEAIQAGAASEVSQLTESIEAMLPRVDEKTRTAVRTAIDRAGGNVTELARIQNRLAGLVNQE